MSVWRSPLLYLGIAIILLVTAALAAPWFIDFNRYRDRISAWGAELTGRPVKIRGEVEVRLFPWPTVTLNDVTVANPPGATQPAFLEAERITARLSLAALLSGRLEVERVDFEKPQLALERLKNGTGTWKLRPHEGVHLPFPPDRIAIAGIHVHDGTILLADARRGGIARLEKVSATITAPRLTGPWRIAATAMMQDQPVTIRISTGRIRPQKPVSFAVRVEPAGGDGLSWSLSGDLNSPKPGQMQADLRIVPVFGKGKADRATGLMLYAISARVEGNLDDLWLRKIEAAPLSAAHAANTITGEAHIVTGPVIEAALSLKAGRFDIDWLIGKDARTSLFGPQGLYELATLTQMLPEDVLLQLDLSVSSLRIGGESLNNFHTVIDADIDRIAIESLSTTLPGGSRLAFHGQLLPLSDLPQLSGDVDFESRDLRGFVFWALPAHQAALARLWRGARGRLSLNAKLDASPAALRLSDGRFTLDDSQGTLALTLGKEALDLTIEARTLNIDRYIPSGLAAPEGEGNPGTALLELIAAAMQFGDTRADVKAGRLHLWGLPMKGVDIALAVTAEKAQISRFDIADLAGVRMQAQGALTFPDDTVKGEITARITARDSARLWRLLAGYGEKTAPDWLAGLGGMDLSFTATARGVEEGADVQALLKGKAGPMEVNVQAGWRGRLSRWREGTLDVNAEIAAPRSTPLLALIRSRLAARSSRASDTTQAKSRIDPPARAILVMKGRPQKDVATTLSLELAGLDMRFEGAVRNPNTESSWTGQGRLAARTSRAGSALALFGLGSPSSMPNTFWAEADAAFSPGHIRLRKLHGNVGETAFAGELSLARSEEDFTAQQTLETSARTWQIEGRIHADHLTASALLSPLLTAPASPDGRFRPKVLESLPFGRIEMNADVMAVVPGLSLKDGKLLLAHERPGLTITLTAGSPPKASQQWPAKQDNAADEQALKEGLFLSALLKQARTGLVVSGKTRMRLATARHLIRTDGTPLFRGVLQAKATFQTAGRTLLSLPANLEGSGRLILSPGHWPRLAPEAFLKAAARLNDANRLTALVNSVLLKADAALPFPGASLPFTIKAGVLSLSPFAWQPRPDLNARLQALADAGKAALDISLEFTPRKVKDDQPGFAIAFAGSPHALQPLPQLDALKDWVAVTALKRSMAELERIERERRRILEEESAFERRQVLFERWRQWAEERARKEAAFRARVESLLVKTEKARRQTARTLRKTLEREAFRRQIERERRMLEERRRRLKNRREQGRMLPAKPVEPAGNAKPAKSASPEGDAHKSGTMTPDAQTSPPSRQKRTSPAESATTDDTISAILRSLRQNAGAHGAGDTKAPPTLPASSAPQEKPASRQRGNKTSKIVKGQTASPENRAAQPVSLQPDMPPTPRRRPGLPKRKPSAASAVTLKESKDTSRSGPIAITPLPPPRPQQHPATPEVSESQPARLIPPPKQPQTRRRHRVITNFGARR